MLIIAPVRYDIKLVMPSVTFVLYDRPSTLTYEIAAWYGTHTQHIVFVQIRDFRHTDMAGKIGMLLSS